MENSKIERLMRTNTSIKNNSVDDLHVKCEKAHRDCRIETAITMPATDYEKQLEIKTRSLQKKKHNNPLLELLKRLGVIREHKKD